MQKIINRWWWVGVGIILMGIWLYGYYKMFFHQDDLDWFILANQSWGGVMSAPIGDHVNYVWRVLLKSEWELFGLQFLPYLTVSVMIHGLVIWMIYKCAKEISGRADLAGIAAILFSANANWSETVLWMSGQTITITALLVLISIYAIARKRRELVALGLASWTSALALGLLVATWIAYPRKRMGIGAILVVVGIFYGWKGTDGTQIEWSVRWLSQVAQVMILAVVNTVVGKFLVPFDEFEMGRIIMISSLLLYGSWRWRGQWREIWRDKWSRFLISQLFFYYLIVAVGRAQYGVGIMRAERYAYLGLALVLLLMARVGRKWEIGRWIWVLPMVVSLQCLGFYARARVYVERPQQMRALFSEVRRAKREEIQMEAYLPHFVLNDERLKYRDLLQLMSD